MLGLQNSLIWEENPSKLLFIIVWIKAPQTWDQHREFGMPEDILQDFKTFQSSPMASAWRRGILQP